MSAAAGAIPATAKTPNAEFLVFGSVANPWRSHTPNDIDLVVPEFNDKDLFYSATVTLGQYERLAYATGKPIDLFFSPYNDDFNLAGWYEPGGQWQFRQAFCGKYFFHSLTLMTFEEVVEAAAKAAVTS
jgi:hypothetical protein